jgi:ATP-dependent Clp protease protease subunit
MTNVKETSKETKSIKDYGIIYISGEINDGTSENICREIIEMNLEDKVESIQIIINSPGGSVSAGFAIVDIMEWSRLPIYTTGLGRIASMGLLIFMAGQQGRRVITPRTSILSHRFWSGFIGSHSDLIAKRKEEDLVHKRIIEHYLQYTSFKTQEELEKTILRECDTWLTPAEAVEYGIADVVEKAKR